MSTPAAPASSSRLLLEGQLTAQGLAEQLDRARAGQRLRPAEPVHRAEVTGLGERDHRDRGDVRGVDHRHRDVGERRPHHVALGELVRHRSRLDWNEHGRRNVCGSPDSSTARSESRCIRASGLSPTPSPAELADSRTTWASRREASRPGSAAYPLITNAAVDTLGRRVERPRLHRVRDDPGGSGRPVLLRVGSRPSTASPRSSRPRTTAPPTFPVAPSPARSRFEATRGLLTSIPGAPREVQLKGLAGDHVVSTVDWAAST